MDCFVEIEHHGMESSENDLLKFPRRRAEVARPKNAPRPFSWFCFVLLLLFSAFFLFFSCFFFFFFFLNSVKFCYPRGGGRRVGGWGSLNLGCCSELQSFADFM